MEVCALIKKVETGWQILGWTVAWDDLVRDLYQPETGIPAEYDGYLIVAIPPEIAKSGGEAVPTEQVTLKVTTTGGFEFHDSSVEGEMTFLPMPEPG